MTAAGNPTFSNGFTASETDGKAAVRAVTVCHRFSLAGQPRMTEAVTGLHSTCMEHKKPVRTRIPLFVTQSQAQACQTQPCNVKC